MTKQCFPPSLSRIPGQSDRQLQDDRVLKELSRSISNLPSKRDTFDPEEAAQDLYSAFLLVKVFTSQERKRGCASPASVSKQLKQIRAGPDTLVKRLKAADLNVFEALREAAEDREIAKEEWLQLRALLETISDRAKRAARAADVVLKALPQAKGKKGRRVDQVADLVSIVAAEVYLRGTGKLASRSIDRDTGQAQGAFHAFLTQIFQALDISASPNASNARLQEILKKQTRK